MGLNKIDIRGDGGYIMVAPSHGYNIDFDQNYPMSSMEDLPVLLQDDLQKVHMYNNGGKVETIREKLTEDPKQEGSRNDTLARLVRQVGERRLGHARGHDQSAGLESDLLPAHGLDRSHAHHHQYCEVVTSSGTPMMSMQVSCSGRHPSGRQTSMKISKRFSHKKIHWMN